MADRINKMPTWYGEFLLVMVLFDCGKVPIASSLWLLGLDVSLHTGRRSARHHQRCKSSPSRGEKFLRLFKDALLNLCTLGILLATFYVLSDGAATPRYDINPCRDYCNSEWGLHLTASSSYDKLSTY